MDAIIEWFTVPEDLVWIVSSNVQPKKTKYSLLNINPEYFINGSFGFQK